jgi:hypothetical protein
MSRIPEHHYPQYEISQNSHAPGSNERKNPDYSDNGRVNTAVFPYTAADSSQNLIPSGPIQIFRIFIFHLTTFMTIRLMIITR